MSFALFTSFAASEWGVVVACYLLGALPFGVILTRLVKGIDLRTVGSGNIGATNTVRALGAGWGLFVFLLDFGKGWLPVRVLAPYALGVSGGLGVEAAPEGLLSLQVASGTAAVLGHCFPVYLAFKGGKGVATGCGAIVGIDPLVFLIGGAVWLVTVAVMRFAGLGSILMGIAFPFAAYARHPGAPVFVAGTALLTVLILLRHKSNIARMLAGTEPRMGGKHSPS